MILMRLLRKTQNFISRESLNEIMAKCATKDGFSIKGITSSEAIRGFVASRNYKMPKSETTVMKYIMDFYKEKRRINGVVIRAKKIWREIQYYCR